MLGYMFTAGAAALAAYLGQTDHQPRRPRRAPEEATSHLDTSPPPSPHELADSWDVLYGGVPTMHKAAALGHLRYLHLHNDMDPLRFSIPDYDGNPPMYYAVKYNQYEAIRFLGQRYRDTNTMLTPRQIEALEQLGNGYLMRYLRGEQTIEHALDAIFTTAVDTEDIEENILAKPTLPDLSRIPQEYIAMEAVLKKCLRVNPTDHLSAAELLKMVAEAFPDELAHPCMTEPQHDLLTATRPGTTRLAPALPPREEVVRPAPPQPESEPAVVRLAPAIPEWLRCGGVAGAHASAFSGHVVPLKRFRRSNQHFYEETDQYGKTPFYYAVLMDRYEAVVFLGLCYKQDSVYVPPQVVRAIEGLGKNYLRKYLDGHESIEDAVKNATDVLYAPHVG